jgi:hypothetical protein
MTEFNSERMFIGVPCKRGHSGIRYKSNRGCVDCDRANTAANLDYHLAYQRVRRAKLKDDPEYKRQNRERVARYRREHFKDASASEAHRAAVKYNTINLIYYGETAYNDTVRRKVTSESDENNWEPRDNGR